MPADFRRVLQVRTGPRKKYGHGLSTNNPVSPVFWLTLFLPADTLNSNLYNEQLRGNKMKRTLIILCAVLCLTASSVWARDAVGSFFGTLSTAQAMGQGRGNLGAGIGLGDNATSFVGTFAYGLSTYTDGRLKLGLVDPDGGDTEFTFGADFKWQFWSYGPNTTHPFDFAVGGFFEYADIGGQSVFQVGGQLLGSYPIVLKSGGTLAPYGRFNARLESISRDLLPGDPRDDSDSNLQVGLNAGLQWIMTPTVALFGEFQFDGNDGVFFGIDFNVM
jgi:hypothetical protein